METKPVKLQNMVMCGDHPSVTKAQLSLGEMEGNGISPSFCTEPRISRAEASPVSASSHALRLERKKAVAEAAVTSKALVHAAMGSFRWPPYLICVWIVALVSTHALYSLVGLLEKALPMIRKSCEYFRKWTEDVWRMEQELNQRIYPLVLATFTASLYMIFCILYLVQAVLVWCVEPLNSEEEEENKIINYDDRSA